MSDRASSEGRGEVAGLAAILAAGLTPAIGIAVAAFRTDAEWDGGAILSVMAWVAGIALLVALFHMALAAPLYLALKRQGWVNWFTAGLGGVLVALVPLSFSIMIGGGALSSWRFELLWFAASGLVGGLTFRAVLGKPA